MFGYGLGKAAGKARKKKKLKAGMMKATGQSPAQKKKIKERVDLAAKRKSAMAKKKKSKKK